MRSPPDGFSPFSVALVGADGAGKTTIARRLERESPVPLKYLYMGINPEASNYLLPTTRLWLAVRKALGRAPDQGGPPSLEVEAPRRSVSSSLKRSLRLVQRLAEEWYRQGVAWHYQRHGSVVVFDRHFFADFYAHEIAARDRPRPLSARLHGWLLDRFYPRPELLIVLDASAEVLFARKGEGTPESLERRRQEYLELRDVVDHFELIDAGRDLDVVMADVMARIMRFGEQRDA
ncbi:MAG: hypothetical protein JRH16_12590 [Deltaproteobacteria bacterium]|nr:hypothetical protein [Deltaproteobacteria bacterium]MBW2360806.1 hypothetical protein [Deltaproteobacteria bacterium]